ncbi:MAG: transglutaminase domain-containing protein [Clostridia bacterium]|nr:transglutaminase domain-containing protein [Clostridia bacterium]
MTDYLKKHTLKKQYAFYILLSLGPLAVIARLLGIHSSLVRLWLHILCIQNIAVLGYLYPMMIGPLLTATVLGLAILHSWQPHLFIVLPDGFLGFLINLKNYISGFDLLKPAHALLALYLFGLLFATITLHVMKKSKRFAPYFFAVLLYQLYAWYHYVDDAYAYIVLFTTMSLLVSSFKEFEKNPLSIKDEDEGKATLKHLNQWMRVTRYYVLIILCLALLFPKFDPLLRWTPVESFLMQNFPALSELRQDATYSRIFSSADLFNLSQAGFGNSAATLGGPIELNHDIAFSVQAPYPLYLRGNVLTNYTGKGWEHGSDFKREYDTDINMGNDLSRGERLSLTVTNRGLSSFTLFTPYQTIEISIERPGKLWVDYNGQVTLLGARYKDEAYTINAIRPEASENASLIPESIRFYREEYVQLPENLPERIYILASEITASADTPYDKALAINDYLKNNYTYTLTTEFLPAGEDFVDHFLFVEKRGYCTYFASSLSILLRTLDIPTRYVEGFRMPTDDDNGTYEIPFSNGHAWVEAYFDGRGWITLEPTPGMQTPENPHDIRSIDHASATDIYDLDMERAYFMDMKKDGIIPSKTKDASLDTSGGTDHKDDNWFLKSPMLLLYLILLLPLRALYVQHQISHYFNRLEYSEHKITYLYSNILQLYAHIGAARENGETEKEYAKRVRKRLYNESHDFEIISERYIQHKYGLVAEDQALYDQLLNFFHFAEIRIHHKLGFYQFFKRKYLLDKLYIRYLDKEKP